MEEVEEKKEGEEKVSIHVNIAWNDVRCIALIVVCGLTAGMAVATPTKISSTVKQNSTIRVMPHTGIQQS